jgi:uncharacterized protein YbaR (Trm112 family)
VLEHIKNPIKFLSEIKRISTGAYIASPSPFTELIHGGFQDVGTKLDKKYSAFLHHGKGTLGHLWYILETHDKLFMLAKTDELYPIYLLFGYYIKNKTNYSKHKFFRSHSEWSETQLFKKSLENVEVVILGDVNNKQEEKVDIDELILSLENISTPKNFNILLKSLIRKLFFSTRKQFNILDLICCPICREKLSRSDNKLVCSNCGPYPLIKNIPILLREALKR